jgi:5-formaminoimidazole-4-carboxamide-1-(beta)-D-ribofuranosyl 5'-monophosphate synthetase
MTSRAKASAPSSRNPKDYAIATIGSHSALQILKGAKDEGVPSIVICKKGTERAYKSYGLGDTMIVVDSWDEWESTVEPELLKRNGIIIPHGSFISNMGHARVQSMIAPKSACGWRMQDFFSRKFSRVRTRLIVR